jgi:hypothetical protein
MRSESTTRGVEYAKEVVGRRSIANARGAMDLQWRCRAEQAPDLQGGRGAAARYAAEGAVLVLGDGCYRGVNFRGHRFEFPMMW